MSTATDPWSDIAAQLRAMRAEAEAAADEDEIVAALRTAHSLALAKVEEIRHERAAE